MKTVSISPSSTLELFSVGTRALQLASACGFLQYITAQQALLCWTQSRNIKEIKLTLIVESCHCRAVSLDETLLTPRYIHSTYASH